MLGNLVILFDEDLGMAIKPKKRELINTGTGTRYVKHPAGTFKKSVDVGESVTDSRRKSEAVAKPGDGDQGDQRKTSPKRKQAAKTSAKKIPLKSVKTRSQPAKSSRRTSRGTLVSMTGDETDEELDQMVDEMLEALGFKNKKKKKRAALSHNRL
jgi:hypothetical protein